MTAPTSNRALDRLVWVLVALGFCGLGFLFISRGLAPTFKSQKNPDFNHFYWAAEAMTHGRDLYNSGQGAYIYPPLLAWLLTPLTHLTLKEATRVWLAINLVLTAVSLVVLSREMVRRLGIRPERMLLACVALLSLLANFDQIRCEFEMGQSDTVVLIGFALGLAFLDTRPWLAGMALGLAFNVKYQSLLVLPYLVLRRRWSAAASMVASSLALLFLPALTQGWSENLRSISVAFAGMFNKVGLGPGADVTKAANLYPTGYLRSLSVTSVAARLVDGEGHPMRLNLAILGCALVFLGLGWLMYRARGVPLVMGRTPTSEGRPPMSGVVALEWVGIIVVALAFSPHTTARHMFLILPVHVLAFAMICRPRPGVNAWPLIVGTAVFTLGILFPPGGNWPEAPLELWRNVGGPGWCMLVFYFTLVWTGLAYVRAPASAEHAAEPSSKRVTA